MMVQLPLRLQLGVWLVGLLLLGACGQRGRPEQFDRLRPLEYQPSVEFLAEPIVFCRSSGGTPEPTRVQILVDGSGSMAGFKSVVPELVSWIQHGVSLLRQSTLEIEEGRVCQFSKALGDLDGLPASECRPGINEALSGYETTSDTNLHLAIRSAMDYDLSVIVTDGIAATGSGGIGDCASGVDAGCVARSLRQVLQDQESLSEEPDWGFWVLPIWAFFDGPYYTEQKILPTEFDALETAGLVLAEVNAEPRIGEATTISDGTLRFEYAGPRGLVLLVLARKAEVGRAMVQALWDRTELAGLERFTTTESWAGRTGVLTPWEIYPGYIESVSWLGLAPSREIPAKGTIDARLMQGRTSQSPQLRIGCPPKEAGEGYFTLVGEAQRSTQRAGCVGIQMVPAEQRSLELGDRSAEDDVGYFLAGYRPSESDPSSLDLHLRCGPQAEAPCSSPIEMTWQAQMAYGHAADCLAAADCRQGAVPQIRAISTLEPSRLPHRIYGIAETVEELLRLLSSESHVQSIADFQICRPEL